jgi:hypothetical protein
VQCLIRDARRKVFLILDRLPVHRSAVMRDWLARHKAKIEVFYLPSYFDKVTLCAVLSRRGSGLLELAAGSTGLKPHSTGP